jgi:hypothetical protein
MCSSYGSFPHRFFCSVLAKLATGKAVLAKLHVLSWHLQVDVGRSTAVSSRFTIKSTPSAILFRDRAMYLVPWEESALSDADKLSAAVHSFVSTGYEEQVG